MKGLVNKGVYSSAKNYSTTKSSLPKGSLSIAG
jgi:hypothetical protein